MISERDLQEAIAECQGKRNPDANTCIKLAAFLTIQRELFGESEQLAKGMTFAAPPIESDGIIHSNGGSDFLQAVDGRKVSDVLPVIDELLLTLQAIQPRLYDGVMRKFE